MGFGKHKKRFDNRLFPVWHIGEHKLVGEKHMCKVKNAGGGGPINSGAIFSFPGQTLGKPPPRE